MDVDRLTQGEKIAGVAAIVLFISMFFAWFGFDNPAAELENQLGVDVGGSFTFNAWESFDFIDLVLLVTVVAALGTVVAKASDALIDFPLNAVVAVLGGLSTLLVLYRVIDPPGGSDRELGCLPRPDPLGPGRLRRLPSDAGRRRLLRRGRRPLLRRPRRRPGFRPRRRLTPATTLERQHPATTTSASSRRKLSRLPGSGGWGRSVLCFFAASAFGRPALALEKVKRAPTRHSPRHLLGERDDGHHRVDAQ